MSYPDHPVSYRNMTPEEVLQVLVEYYKVELEAEEAAPNRMPHFAMSLSDWEDSNYTDFMISYPNGGMGQYFNDLFNVEIPECEWKPLLNRKKSTTLKIVCEKIATYSKVPSIKPVTLMGTNCRLAGIFLFIRNAMQASGVDVCELRPSTRLSSYSETGLPFLWRDLMLLAPGLVSRMRTHYASDFYCLICAAFLFFSTLVGSIVSFASPMIGVPWAAISACAFVWIWRWSEGRQERPLCVEFTELRTFRDLSEAIAKSTNASSPNH